jgi:hypothetical protein
LAGSRSSTRLEILFQHLVRLPHEEGRLSHHERLWPQSTLTGGNTERDHAEDEGGVPRLMSTPQESQVRVAEPGSISRSIDGGKISCDRLRVYVGIKRVVYMDGFLEEARN